MPAKRAVPHIDFKHFELSQCFGITPIFVNTDDTIDCNLFNLYRKYHARRVKDRAMIRWFTQDQADVKFVYHKKTEEEKKELVKNAINYYQLGGYCMRAIRQHSKTYDFDITIDQFLSQSKKYVQNIVLCAALNCFIHTKLVTGNRFVSSNKKLLDLLNVDPAILGIYKRIVVPESLIPQNELLICANGGMTYDNGILLCPIIYRQELMKWMFENDKSDDFSDMKFSTYPIMREWRYKCDLYGEYINECIPLEWHIEVFEKNASNFYTFLHFKP